MAFIDDIQNSILCGDGAMGTLLIERGIVPERCFEELCVSEPAMISDIHAEYLSAGARVIGTNSFGANAVRLARFGLENHVNEINWQSVQIAKQAAKGTKAYIAGSVGPLGVSAADAECQGIDRKGAFQEQIGALLDGGVNLIIFETFLDVEELLLALYVKQSLHHCPAVCMLSCADNDADSLGKAFQSLRRADAEIIGVNCISGPHAVLPFLRYATEDIPFAVYPSVGLPQHPPASPQDFYNVAFELIKRGAALIGGCCGTTPAHIRAVAKAIEDANSSKEN